MRRGVVALSLALLAALVPAAAAAQDDPAALAQAATERLRAAARSHEAAAHRHDRVRALAETVRAYEDGLAALRAGLRLATQEEARLAGAFAARSGEVSQLLGVLASIETSPAPVNLLHPSGPVGAARAAMLAGDAGHALRQEAAALRRALDEIRALRAIQAEAQDTLAAALRGAQDARTELSHAIAARSDLPRRFAADPDRMRALVAASETLAALATTLGAMDLSPPGGAPLAPARGALPLPVEGIVRHRFNEPDAAGVARPGLVLETRSGALVTAPFDATVRYTGPLLDYGNVMILEPEAATLLVLSGLGALYAETGQIVSRGDPLGQMGETAVARADVSTHGAHATDAERTETLYIELRRGGTPADPAEWFAVDRQE